MTLRLGLAGLRLALLVLAALVVLRWRIGPTLFGVDGSGTLLDGHGVHAGDPLGVLAALLAVPWRRPHLDRRIGVRAPLAPNPMRRASDRTDLPQA